MTRDQRLERIEKRQQQLAAMMSRLLDQLSEQSLRVRFIMEFFKFERPAHGGLIVDGKAETVRATLLDIYVDEGRDQVLRTIQAEMLAASLAEAQKEAGSDDDSQAPGSNGAQPAEGAAAAGESAEGDDAPAERAAAADRRATKH